jgi:hypothetical protein
LPATGPATGPIPERHSDLAVAGYLAAQVLKSARVPVAECQLVEVAGRFQLHTARFDRVPPRGRRAFWPLEAAQPGLPARLADALPVLRRRGALGPGVAQSLAWLVAFAQCLGEDLDAAQVAVAPTGAAAHLPVPPWAGLPAPKPLDWRPPPQAQVACVTGVSPSHYAPLPDGTLPAHTLPAPAADVPRAARAAAERYWRTVAQDSRVSFNFRVIAAANGRVMEQRPVRAAALAGETTA